jgi:hypothetical protein
VRKLALVLTGILVFGFAAPAFAQTGASAKVNNPGDGAVVSGSTGVSGTASAGTGVRNAKMFINDSLVASAEPSSLRQNVDLNYNWDTTSAMGGGIARNGWYTIRVEMNATGGGTSSSKVSVMVDNAPQAPSGFDGYVQDTTATLSWGANPEPDIQAYRIEVANDGAWSTVTETTGTSYTANLQPGSYQFRVLALRSSPAYANGHPSTPSSTLTLTIQAPPSSGGSGTGSGGVIGSGGGGRGATGGGDPRVYGHDGAASTRDVKDTARAFASGGISFGGISLPGGMALPNLDTAAPFKWGTYKERLPYSLPQGGIPLDAAPPRLAALSTTRIIPMDALRWVGAGVLMIVIAALLQFVGWRAETIARLGTDGAAALRIAIPKIAIPRSFPKVAMPAVSLKDANVRLRRVQDRVRAAWTKARSS